MSVIDDLLIEDFLETPRYYFRIVSNFLLNTFVLGNFFRFLAKFFVVPETYMHSFALI